MLVGHCEDGIGLRWNYGLRANLIDVAHRGGGLQNGDLERRALVDPQESLSGKLIG